MWKLNNEENSDKNRRDMTEDVDKVTKSLRTIKDGKIILIYDLKK